MHLSMLFPINQSADQKLLKQSVNNQINFYNLDAWSLKHIISIVP